MKKLTKETAETALELMSMGITERQVATVIGVHPKTLSKWINRPASAAQEDFSRQASRARIEGKAALIKKIEEAADNDWKAAAWLLERKYPSEFARPAVRAPKSNTAQDQDEKIKIFISSLGLN